MFTCVIRYELDLTKLDEFEAYSTAWMALIEKYGGTHHGYFLPGRPHDELPAPAFSFPDLGTQGRPNVAFALFSFSDVQAYEEYRHRVVQDPACQAVTAQLRASRCIQSYERHFLKPLPR